MYKLQHFLYLAPPFKRIQFHTFFSPYLYSDTNYLILC
uniref:Uncharacterized protein n=1 Tax=Anguilla anguilla TaxID=7936 RepID=A0A0E9XLB8_ANGAN